MNRNEKGRSRGAGTALVALAGALGISAVAAPLASASTHAKPASHKVKKQSANGALVAAEKQLSALEAKAGSGVTLTETGSSLFYPLFSTWAQHYSSATVQTASTGSGAGQAGALKGTVDIGASDAYLPASDPATLLNVPVVVSAQQINYNLPGIGRTTHLKLDGAVLNGMYTGKITRWNDAAIQKLNKGVKLPNVKVVPLHRSDGSGDTFLFTSYLAAQDPSSFVNSVGGPNTQVSWPSVPGALAENGNTGMLKGCQTTPGCVAYIGVSYLRGAVASGLGYGYLLNGKGNYVGPTPVNVANEIASYKRIPANGTISLINSKTAKFGYPIVNFEYAVVQEHQPSTAKANAIKALLAWGMDPRHGATGSYLAPVNFKPLPANALAIAINLLKKIS